MTNAQKWVLIGGFLLLSLGSAGYFFWSRAVQAKKAEIHKKTMECRKIAENAFETMKKDYEKYEFTSKYNYSCVYSGKADKCVYRLDVNLSWDNNSLVTARLFDGYTNEMLLGYAIENDKPNEETQKKQDMLEKFWTSLLETQLSNPQ